MKIKLTSAEWIILKDLVAQGKSAERQLGIPLEIANGDQKIEIKSDEVKITLVT